jgi:intracellular sulfur oxidation DsrE/DsrF family protein
MNWKKMGVVAALLLLVGSLPGMAQAKKHHVLFALVSPNESDWSMTILNLRSLTASLADTAELEVVAYGPGVSFLGKGSSATADIQELTAKHVRFAACQNAMRAKHMTAADLIPGVEMVPSGLVEVITKQEQGWTYIKAGQ